VALRIPNAIIPPAKAVASCGQLIMMESFCTNGDLSIVAIRSETVPERNINFAIAARSTAGINPAFFE
jgi:hypothetical protein